MSRLSDVPNLAELIKGHRLEVFVETGAGDGEGLRYAKELGLAERMSCDLNVGNAMAASKWGAVSTCDSVTFLKNLRVTGRCLYWLDAHFGSKFGVVGGDEWPLPEELRVLAGKPGIEHDVIICDDMHCIQDILNPTREDGPGHDWDPVEGTIFELYDPFRETHVAHLYGVSTGVLVMEPK